MQPLLERGYNNDTMQQNVCTYNTFPGTKLSHIVSLAGPIQSKTV